MKVSSDGRNYKLNDGTVVNAERLKRYYHKFDDMVISEGKLVPHPKDADNEEILPLKNDPMESPDPKVATKTRKKPNRRSASADGARSRGSSQHQMTLRPRKPTAQTNPGIT